MTDKRGWALVTGASGGLGAEFARQLAARGYDLVITARRRGRLTELADALAKAHGTRVEVIESDLAVGGAATSIVRELDARSIEPTLVVNNAGVGPHGSVV